MLEVESLRVDISRVGRVLDDVTISAEPGVTVVTGRSGCGTTTLLRLIAGFHDRQVVRRQGVIRLSGRRIDTMSHAELRPQVAVVGHRPTETLGRGDAERDRVIEELGLREWCDRPAARVSTCVAARMALAEGISSGAPVLLLDQLLAPMTSKWRARAVACVAQVARTGRVVLWAEHALDYALGAADSVVEIIDGHARQVEASSWSSTNLPPPRCRRSPPDLAREYSPARSKPTPVWLRQRSPQCHRPNRSSPRGRYSPASILRPCAYRED